MLHSIIIKSLQFIYSCGYLRDTELLKWDKISLHLYNFMIYYSLTFEFDIFVRDYTCHNHLYFLIIVIKCFITDHMKRNPR